MRQLISWLERLPSLLLSFADQLLRSLTDPACGSWLVGTLGDLPRCRAHLLAENALLRHQLLILQRQVKRPRLNQSDRFWLLLLASRISNWKQVLLIIQPDTLLRWHRQGFRLFWKRRSRAKTNQPKLARETIDLIRRIAQENRLWGSERIQAELLKLGVAVAKRTIQKYMWAARPPQAPSQTWSNFLKTLAQDIWACDFLPVVDLFFRQTFVFFVIELGSRRVVHFGVMRHLTEAWVTQQLREATPSAMVRSI